MTGVGTTLYSKTFYSVSKKSKLENEQFYFKKLHPYDLVKEKLPYLIKLSELKKSEVCILKDLKTNTITYKMGVTNIAFTIGMYYKTGYYSPQTLRVKDHSIEKNTDGEIVHFIFEKQYSDEKYSKCLFCDSQVKLPQQIKDMITVDLAKTL